MITVRGADPTVSIQTADQTVFGEDLIDLQATSADLNTPVTSYLWTAVPPVGTFGPVDADEEFDPMNAAMQKIRPGRRRLQRRPSRWSP